MKLSKSNHIYSVCRGGGGRSTHDQNAGTSRGMPKQARAKTLQGGDHSADSTNMTMTLDYDTNTRIWYVYKGETPWSAPPPNESNDTVFHAARVDNAAPRIRQFPGTINLSFTLNEDKHSEVNVSILLKRFMTYAKQTNADFHIKPLNGSAQSITNPSNIPTTKEGFELYYQHRIVGDGVRGKINIDMSKTLGDLKDLGTPFCKNLNNKKVYLSSIPWTGRRKDYRSNATHGSQTYFLR
jgi:hypothetical protein